MLHFLDTPSATYLASVGEIIFSWFGICVKSPIINVPSVRAQELCESRGGRPGLPSLISLMVSGDVKQHGNSAECHQAGQSAADAPGLPFRQSSFRKEVAEPETLHYTLAVVSVVKSVLGICLFTAVCHPLVFPRQRLEFPWLHCRHHHHYCHTIFSKI